jgi:hypothetical protein
LEIIGGLGTTSWSCMIPSGLTTFLISHFRRVGLYLRRRYLLPLPLPLLSSCILNSAHTEISQDKLGDWFESYVKLLELNAWTQTTITGSSWDALAGKWTVTLDRLHDGKKETRIFHPKVRLRSTILEQIQG